jgi:hypothetical protein
MEPHLPKRGYLINFTLFGTPVFIHWTFPVGGLFVAYFLGDLSPYTSFFMVISYTALVLIHEYGHVVMARKANLIIHGVVVAWAGGVCLIDLPRSNAQLLSIYAGGVLAQLVLFVITLPVMVLTKEVQSLAVHSFVFMFTVVNVVFVVINLFPGEGTDGRQIWSVIRDIRNRAY